MNCPRLKSVTTFQSLIGACALLLSATEAHAYLDPATGSILLQGLLAGFAGLMVVLRLHWSKVKNLFRRLRGKPPLAVDAPRGNDSAVSDQIRS